jgi:Arc/MetJ-type ribon-helix-helix transcriptional regulator|tara:strand:+ start:3958 stop:4164 length:207 start_codon:yes stop_codon:yes gene_type:complete
MNGNPKITVRLTPDELKSLDALVGTWGKNRSEVVRASIGSLQGLDVGLQRIRDLEDGTVTPGWLRSRT